MLVLEPVKKTRLYFQIVAKIKEEIKTGRYKPGSRLPSERKLAEVLRVGRSSVREAMTVLESVGLLEIRAGEGAFVRDLRDYSATDTFFTAFAALWDIDPLQILELLEVRKILEPQTAALAAGSASQEDLTELCENLEEMRGAACREEVGESIDFRFHYIIARSTGNKILLNVINALSDLMCKGLRQMRWTALADSERVERIIREHESIVKAIEGGDAVKAKQSMFAHLESVESNFKRYLCKEV